MTAKERLPLAYGGLVLAYLAVSVNLSVTSVALPSIGTDMSASTAQLSWIFNITPLVSVGVVLLAGAWGDRFGRRRLLVIGLSVFLVSSIMSALATDIGLLITFRALTGIGSALVMPAALALSFDVVPQQRRQTAVGILGATQAIGALVGPVLAGAAMAIWSWPAAFLSVTPFIVVALISTRRLPTSRAAATPQMDTRGAVLTSIACAALVYVTIAASAGELLPALIAFLITIAAVIALIVWERRIQHPILDPTVLRQRRFQIATLVVFGSQFVLGGLLFIMTQYLQLVLGYAPLAAGLMLTPALASWVVASATAGRTARLLGIRRAVSLGMALSTVGFAVLAWSAGAEGEPPIGRLAIGLLLVGLMAVGPALMTHAAVDCYPAERRTVGAATNGAAARFGFAFGIALLGGLLGGFYSARVAGAASGLPPEQADLAESGLAGALLVAQNIPQGDELASAARSAFLGGYTYAMLAACLVTAALALIVAIGSQSVEDARHRGARAGT